MGKIYIWDQLKEVSNVGREGFFPRINKGMDPLEALIKPSKRKGSRVLRSREEIMAFFQKEGS